MKTKNIYIIALLISLSAQIGGVLASNIEGDFLPLQIELPENQEYFNFNVKPGELIESQLTVYNGSTVAQNFEIFTRDISEEENNVNIHEINGVEGELTSWTKLIFSQLSVEPSSESTIPFNIAVPNDAAIGKHEMAIFVKNSYEDENGNKLNLENGIRVYVNVEGYERNHYQVLNQYQERKDGQLIVNKTIFNDGNTVLKGFIKLSNHTNGVTPEMVKEIYLRRNQSLTLTLPIETTFFGPERIIEELKLNDITETSVLSNNFNIPPILIYSLLALILCVTLLSSIFFPHKKKHSVRTGTYLLIILFTGIFSYHQDRIENFFLQTNLLNSPTDAYLTTVTWGDFSSSNKDVLTHWTGQLSIENGSIIIKNKVGLEPNDRVFSNQYADTIYFDNLSGPQADLDKVILIIRIDDSTADPKLKLSNYQTGEDFYITLSSNLNSTRTFNYKSHQIQIKSEKAPQYLVTDSSADTTDEESSENLEDPLLATDEVEIPTDINDEEVSEGEEISNEDEANADLDNEDIDEPSNVEETDSEVSSSDQENADSNSTSLEEEENSEEEVDTETSNKPAEKEKDKEPKDKKDKEENQDIEADTSTESDNTAILENDPKTDNQTEEPSDNTDSEVEKEKPKKDFESTEEIHLAELEKESTEEVDINIEEIFPALNFAELQQLETELSLLKGAIHKLGSSQDLQQEFKIDSEQIMSVYTTSNTTVFKLSNNLIKRLSPLKFTLDALSKAEDMNFVFAANDKIKLNPTLFSFKNKATRNSQLNEMIFVHNRTSPWQVSIKVSDLVSVNGKSRISANNITVNPGAIEKISMGKKSIAPGQKKKLGNANDHALLFNAQANNEKEKTIFSIHPDISVDIPANTPPGVYRSEITIVII